MQLTCSEPPFYHRRTHRRNLCSQSRAQFFAFSFATIYLIAAIATIAQVLA